MRILLINGVRLIVAFSIAYSSNICTIQISVEIVGIFLTRHSIDSGVNMDPCCRAGDDEAMTLQRLVLRASRQGRYRENFASWTHKRTFTDSLHRSVSVEVRDSRY
ncbi:hypothetical protein PHSY_006208 [Pseudozyma hubeiensis SY62]|uniref:Secreted protein n=1 Tax=Pseudozyma hubeiensis (strain SY62) TaxID=1305764 RepID=R9PB85_PSEHS|nr:hypothetical protein PHSY_006208 [Pseudozyma hubeiensis SY62]GAC98614.1 hypothetical protein PHSY_006208 [Pseudozyma hubeiensis SY62]